MSEYQYYDFKAVDRALTKTEMAALRSISTRAVITSTSFTNHYEWGDLKADPFKLLEKYFDAFVYVANWGSRTFSLRLPKASFMDAKQIKAMFPDTNVKEPHGGEFVVLIFENGEVDLDFEFEDDGSPWMGALISLRSDLLRGDLRCLYLGWLYSAQNDAFSSDELEPPVPAGLRELSASLESFIEFFGIDEDLVHVAALASEPLKAGPSRMELATCIRGLSETERENLLVNALSGTGDRWRTETLRRFQQQNTASSSDNGRQRRRVEHLLQEASVRTAERERQLEAKRAAAEARQKAKAAAERRLYLDDLAKREKAAWKQVEEHIQKRQPKEYDRAVLLLSDLHELAVRQEDETGFQLIMEELREKHAAMDTFLRRLTQAKL